MAKIKIIGLIVLALFVITTTGCQKKTVENVTLTKAGIDLVSVNEIAEEDAKRKYYSTKEYVIKTYYKTSSDYAILLEVKRDKKLDLLYPEKEYPWVFVSECKKKAAGNTEYANFSASVISPQDDPSVARTILFFDKMFEEGFLDEDGNARDDICAYSEFSVENMTKKIVVKSNTVIFSKEEITRLAQDYLQITGK